MPVCNICVILFLEDSVQLREEVLRMRMRWWLIAALITSAGCGDDSEPPDNFSVDDRDSGVGLRECIDEDDDGFGNQYCEEGRDCDDDDPEVTDECYRCVSPNRNCPCEPGTMAVPCTPDAIQVEGGTLVCAEGTRYCRDGLWSSCEAIGEYTFVPTGR
jgi:hypothetical protein